MSKTKANGVKAAKPEKDVLNKVKAGAVTKPAAAAKSKSKELAKAVASKEGNKSKKQKKVKEPTPEPESESESEAESESEEESEESEESSESESDSESEAEPVTNGKVIMNGKTKPAQESDSDESDSSESEEDEAVPDVPPVEASSEEDESEDDSDEKPAALDKGESEASADSDDDSEEDESEGSTDESSEEESDSEEEEKEKPAAAVSKKRKAEDESPFAAKKNKADAEANVESQGANLFVGNLSWNVDEDWLSREFGEYGELAGVRIVYDRQSGRSKGFGYVEYVNAVDAGKAYASRKDTEIDNRTINLDWASGRSSGGGQDRAQARAKSFGDTTSPASDTLFVGNLSFDADQDSVSEAFGEYGTITGVRLPTDRETGAPKGFGYVTFSSIDEAKAALEAMQGYNLSGRSLRLDYSTPRPSNGDSPARGGRGGGRGSFGGRGGGRGGFGDRGGRGGARGGRGGFGDRGGRGGRSGTTNRGGFGDFSGKKTSFD